MFEEAEADALAAGHRQDWQMQYNYYKEISQENKVVVLFNYNFNDLYVNPNSFWYSQIILHTFS